MLRSLPRARVLVPPTSLVQLWAWLRSADAEGWWACVGWTKSVRTELVLCTGWVAAEQVRPAADESYVGVPRLRLPGPPETWPPPAPVAGDYRWPGPFHHFGLLYGQRLPEPETGQRLLWIGDPYASARLAGEATSRLESPG